MQPPAFDSVLLIKSHWEDRPGDYRGGQGGGGGGALCASLGPLLWQMEFMRATLLHPDSLSRPKFAIKELRAARWTRRSVFIIGVAWHSLVTFKQQKNVCVFGGTAVDWADCWTLVRGKTPKHQHLPAWGDFGGRHLLQKSKRNNAITS